MDVCLTGTRTFRILCTQSKLCGDSEDIARIVRDYLIVSISQMSDVFWRFVAPKLLTSLPFNCKLHASVCWVDSAILVDFESGEEDETRQKIYDRNAEDLVYQHDILLDIAGERRSQTKTAVSVIIDLLNITSTWREVRWSVKWESLDTPKFWSAPVPVGKETILNMINVINNIRYRFDERVNEERTSATTRFEVPTTWHELDDFFIQQLFGHTRVLSSNFGPQKWLRSTT
jgi:hypothetical protein